MAWLNNHIFIKRIGYNYSLMLELQRWFNYCIACVLVIVMEIAKLFRLLVINASQYPWTSKGVQLLQHDAIICLCPYTNTGLIFPVISVSTWCQGTLWLKCPKGAIFIVENVSKCYKFTSCWEKSKRLIYSGVYSLNNKAKLTVCFSVIYPVLCISYLCVENDTTSATFLYIMQEKLFIGGVNLCCAKAERLPHSGRTFSVFFASG